MILKPEELLEESRVDLLPDALVTVSFEGLALSCLNAEGECEVGMMRRDDHTLIMEVLQLRPDGSVIDFEHDLRLDLDIKIEVTHPAQDRADRFRGSEFDRINEVGDPKDSRWLIDLESDEVFHKKALEFITVENGRAGGLNPIFVIPRGMLYTRQRVKNTLLHERWDDSKPGGGDPRFLGKIGHVCGIDITSEANTECKVLLTNIDDRGDPVAGIPPLELPREPGVKYLIKVSNLCNTPGDFNSNLPGQGTDFRFYYDVVKDPEGKKFDLKETVKPSSTGNNPNPVIDRPDLGVGFPPQACEFAGMSKTGSLRGQ